MYKEGDKVLVIDCQPNIKSMRKFIGKVCTIQSVAMNDCYILEEDEGKFYWIEEWLEPYTQITINEDNILNLLGDEYAIF